MIDRLLLLLAIALASLVFGLAVFWHPEPPERPLPRAAMPAGGDFTVLTADGALDLQSLRGKLVLLYFGYTYCPDICPTSLAATADGLRELSPEELARVAVLFVSVDPKRDTPARLKEYAAFFHPSIIGATASPETIADIARRYGVFYAEQKLETAGDGYVVDHTSDTYIVDAGGRLVGRIAHATPAPLVAASLRKYLNQP